jgi:predicted outer membrane repeat protein
LLYSSYNYLNTSNFTSSFDHLTWNIMSTSFDLNLACNGQGGGISGTDFGDGHPRRELHAARCELARSKLGTMARSELGVTARSELGAICSPVGPCHV